MKLPAEILRYGSLVIAALLIAGCATVPAPTVSPASDADTERETAMAWARVLERFVDAHGRIDFDALSRDRADLDRYVAWIYRTGPNNQPELFPTRDHVLAYHINAYNALAMYNVLDAGVPNTLAGARKISFFFLRRVQVGGTAMSLYAYENDVIRKLAEPRVHFALNCMVVGCPRLPREPFNASRLEMQLDRETWRFFEEPRNVRIDRGARTLYLSEILDFYSVDFLAQAASLPAYVNRYRAEQVPDDYTVRFIPYDWTINRHTTVTGRRSPA
jgi:hypothetical protein